MLATVDAEEAEDFPRFSGGADVLFTLKVENDGTSHSVFDELGAFAGMELSPWSTVFLRLEVPELMGYNAGWTDGDAGKIFVEKGFPRTLAYLESAVLEQAGLSPSVSPFFYLGYGSRQQALVEEFTRYRYERSGTSGIDGFDFAAGIIFAERFSLTTAFNPASLGSENGDPDVYAAFDMVNDHRGSSWGQHIHFTSSSMQLFYDSSANLEANRLYDNPERAMTLGIGGTLVMTFVGIEIYGFGMTEYFLMYNRSDSDILQAQWGAGFLFPLLGGFEVNLSGNNAIFMSGGGDDSFINIGLDMQLMLNRYFGWFGAVATVGILDDFGVSLESGLCFDLGFFEIYAGYSNLAIGTEDKYAKGAFDKAELREGIAPDGGFFLTAGVSF